MSRRPTEPSFGNVEIIDFDAATGFDSSSEPYETLSERAEARPRLTEHLGQRLIALGLAVAAAVASLGTFVPTLTIRLAILDQPQGGTTSTMTAVGHLSAWGPYHLRYRSTTDQFAPGTDFDSFQPIFGIIVVVAALLCVVAAALCAHPQLGRQRASALFAVAGSGGLGVAAFSLWSEGHAFILDSRVDDVRLTSSSQAGVWVAVAAAVLAGASAIVALVRSGRPTE